jgi:hypothetical protein
MYGGMCSSCYVPGTRSLEPRVHMWSLLLRPVDVPSVLEHGSSRFARNVRAYVPEHLHRAECTEELSRFALKQELTLDWEDGGSDCSKCSRIRIGNLVRGRVACRKADQSVVCVQDKRNFSLLCPSFYRSE